MTGLTDGALTNSPLTCGLVTTQTDVDLAGIVAGTANTVLNAVRGANVGMAVWRSSEGPKGRGMTALSIARRRSPGRANRA